MKIVWDRVQVFSGSEEGVEWFLCGQVGRRRGAEGAGGGISRESGRARTVIAASERGLHSPPPLSSCTCHYGITARPPPPLTFIVVAFPPNTYLRTRIPLRAVARVDEWVGEWDEWVGGWVDGWSGSTRPLQWISREVAWCGCTGFNSRTTTLTHGVAAARMHTIHQRKE